MNKIMGQDENDTLIFVKRDRIFSLNFETEEISTIMKFKDDLILQPEYFCMTTDQKCCIASTNDNSLWFDIENQREVDLDELYNIANIREVINDPEDKVFYFLANMMNEKTGFFLTKLD